MARAHDSRVASQWECTLSALRNQARRDFMRQASAVAGGLALVPGVAHARETVMDFRGALPSGVRFRRASPATVMDEDGSVRSVEQDAPRFPVKDGKPLGLLIEGEATNFLINASRPDASGWNPGSGARAALTGAAINTPDGSGKPFRIPRAAPAANGLYDAVMSKVPWAEYGTASVWLRTTTGSGKWRLRLRDFTTYNGMATVVDVGPQWRRYVMRFAWHTRDTGAKRFSVLFNEPVQPAKNPPVYALNRVNLNQPVATPLDLEGVLMWGAQYESGNEASSFIATGETPASRKADEVTFPASAINPRQGMLTLSLPQGGRKGGVLLDAGTEGGIRLAYSNSGWLTARVGELELSGFGDATEDSVVRLAWNAEGAQISSGKNFSSLVQRAGRRASIGTPKLGDTVRLGMAQGGTQPLGKIIASLAISDTAGAIQPTTLPKLVPAMYTLSFSDEFDEADLSRINESATGGRTGAPAWRSRYRHARQEVINKEKQIYMDAAFAGTSGQPLGVQPFSIRDSVLRIRAERADPERVSPHIWNHRYTSGCISSELTHWQKYGYFEIGARLPRGKGFWPAFWLLPKREAWPPEIDIFEASGVRPYSVHCGVLEKPRTAATPAGIWIDQFIDISDGFHNYALDWTPKNMVFFIDGTKVFDYGEHNIHEDMYLLANLALGSHDPNWIPDPDASTPFPSYLEIDYIRGYRRTN